VVRFGSHAHAVYRSLIQGTESRSLAFTGQGTAVDETCDTVDRFLDRHLAGTGNRVRAKSS
jgi:hypothetical protein